MSAEFGKGSRRDGRRTAFSGISGIESAAPVWLNVWKLPALNWWFTEVRTRKVSAVKHLRDSRGLLGCEITKHEECPSTMCTKWRKEYTKWSTTSCTSTVPRSERCITKWVLQAMITQKDPRFPGWRIKGNIKTIETDQQQKPHNECRVLKIK